MADLLRRSLAPITDAAWEQINETASRVLKAQLSARTLVDFDGPHGWEFAAVNLGTLAVAKGGGKDEVPWGTRDVLPLIELRVPVVLNQMEMDNASRGRKNVDLGPLEEAARKLAMFEETAIYRGFEKGHIKGIAPSSSHKPIKLPAGADAYPEAVADAVKTLALAGIGGPCALALGTKPYYALMQSVKGGYPPRRVIEKMLSGPIVWSPALEGGLLLSTRGGDFELVVGQDASIGYASHDRNEVELFLTESFTFRVLEAAAAIELKSA
jgi:uncharacterized linocin/CFP29 family protein